MSSFDRIGVTHSVPEILQVLLHLSSSLIMRIGFDMKIRPQPCLTARPKEIKKRNLLTDCTGFLIPLIFLKDLFSSDSCLCTYVSFSLYGRLYTTLISRRVNYATKLHMHEYEDSWLKLHPKPGRDEILPKLSQRIFKRSSLWVRIPSSSSLSLSLNRPICTNILWESSFFMKFYANKYRVHSLMKRERCTINFVYTLMRTKYKHVKLLSREMLQFNNYKTGYVHKRINVCTNRALPPPHHFEARNFCRKEAIFHLLNSEHREEVSTQTIILIS